MDNIICEIFYSTSESVDTATNQSNGICIQEPAIKLEQVNLHALLETFRSIPWKQLTEVAEISIYSEKESENKELFIVGQYDDGTFWLDFNIQKRVKLLGLIPHTKDVNLHLSSIRISEVEDCIKKFVDYPHESLLEWIETKQKDQKNNLVISASKI